MRDDHGRERKAHACGTGWTAWILGMQAYRYNDFGEIEELGGEFAGVEGR